MAKEISAEVRGYIKTHINLELVQELYSTKFVPLMDMVLHHILNLIRGKFLIFRLSMKHGYTSTSPPENVATK